MKASPRDFEGSYQNWIHYSGRLSEAAQIDAATLQESSCTPAAALAPATDDGSNTNIRSVLLLLLPRSPGTAREPSGHVTRASPVKLQLASRGPREPPFATAYTARTPSAPRSSLPSRWASCSAIVPRTGRLATLGNTSVLDALLKRTANAAFVLFAATTRCVIDV